MLDKGIFEIRVLSKIRISNYHESKIVNSYVLPLKTLIWGNPKIGQLKPFKDKLRNGM